MENNVHLPQGFYYLISVQSYDIKEIPASSLLWCLSWLSPANTKIPVLLSLLLIHITAMNSSWPCWLRPHGKSLFTFGSPHLAKNIDSGGEYSKTEMTKLRWPVPFIKKSRFLLAFRHSTQAHGPSQCYGLFMCSRAFPVSVLQTHEPHPEGFWLICLLYRSILYQYLSINVADRYDVLISCTAPAESCSGGHVDMRARGGSLLQWIFVVVIFLTWSPIPFT